MIPFLIAFLVGVLFFFICLGLLDWVTNWSHSNYLPILFATVGYFTNLWLVLFPLSWGGGFCIGVLGVWVAICQVDSMAPRRFAIFSLSVLGGILLIAVGTYLFHLLPERIGDTGLVIVLLVLFVFLEIKDWNKL